MKTFFEVLEAFYFFLDKEEIFLKIRKDGLMRTLGILYLITELFYMLQCKAEFFGLKNKFERLHVFLGVFQIAILGISVGLKQPESHIVTKGIPGNIEFFLDSA